MFRSLCVSLSIAAVFPSFLACGGGASDGGSGSAASDGSSSSGGSGSSGNDGSGGNGAASGEDGCEKISLRDDAFAFELVIRNTANYYYLGFPKDLILHCPEQRIVSGKGDDVAETACENNYFYKKEVAAPESEIVESIDVLIPFVPEEGIDLELRRDTPDGDTEFEVRGFDGTTWAKFKTSGEKSVHIDRADLIAGGLASKFPEWPAIEPKMGAFLFPWYGTPEGPQGAYRHWDPDAPTLYTPAKGLYDSYDPAVIEAQMNEAKAAGLNLFVLSYWEKEEPPLDVFLDAAESGGMEISVIFETAARGDGTPRENLLAQIETVRDEFGAHPAFLKAEGRPIFFLYDRITGEFEDGKVGATSWDDWEWVAASLGEERPIVFFPLAYNDWTDVGPALFGGGFEFAANEGGSGLFTGAHGDNWAWSYSARTQGALFAATVLPSFMRERTLDDEANYRNQWHAVRSVMPDIVLVNSWNEYHESTIIEPTEEFGARWLELTKEEAGKLCDGVLGEIVP